MVDIKNDQNLLGHFCCGQAFQTEWMTTVGRFVQKQLFLGLGLYKVPSGNSQQFAIPGSARHAPGCL